MDYAAAIKITNRLVQLFTPHCILCNVAGSIRRQRQEVKDIELVCLPRYEHFKIDMFNGEWRIPPAYKATIDLVAASIIKGQVGGRYMQVQLKGGAMLDLFTPQLHDYYRIYAIRTGSADYAHLRLAGQWTKLGWCGTPDGLRLQAECIKLANGSWKCFKDKPTLPPAWKSEEEFFGWLQIPWIEPIYREINHHQKTFLKEDL